MLEGRFFQAAPWGDDSSELSFVLEFQAKGPKFPIGNWRNVYRLITNRTMQYGCATPSA
jgi:hypothetical protein